MTCLICRAPIAPSDSVYQFCHQREDLVHLTHKDCIPEPGKGGDNAIPSCLTCSELHKAPRTFGLSSPLAAAPPHLAVLGHGQDSPSDTTFVPKGMTLYTYAEPGKTLSELEARIVCMNPLLYPTKGTFPELADIPNIILDPLESDEEELDLRAWADSMRNTEKDLESPLDLTAAKQKIGDVVWVTGRELLCTDWTNLCKRPFHVCDGLLGKYRGVGKLYIASCFGAGGAGDEYSDTASAYMFMTQCIMHAGTMDLSKALNLFDSMREARKMALFAASPNFVKWYDAAMAATEGGRETLEWEWS
ncbi:putative adhesin [Streptomyces sp. NPDC048419]|uniref:putative adhesin n=1 Tax=Streptomyces sp. NPDC048419 TaxID=3365547 RepID=UPI00371AB76B